MHELCFSAALLALLATSVVGNQENETSVSTPASLWTYPQAGATPTLAPRTGDLVTDAVRGPSVEKGKENRVPTWEPATQLNLDAGAEKPGLCPRPQADLNCTHNNECQSDGDCERNLKCCQSGCGSVCAVPNEKPGTCPSVDLPQLGICEDQCQEDSQCSGVMKCCRNGCGKVSCVTPNF